MAYKGIEYMRAKLLSKRKRVLTRYKYYEMKNVTLDLGISTPPQLQWLLSSLGWCGKAVDSLADRLQFRYFDNDITGLSDIFAMNNPDVLFDSAIISALITSCCFIYISADEECFPRLQVIDGGNATGVLDPITNFLTEGYAVLARDEFGAPTVEAYFTKEETAIYTGETVQRFVNPARFPALVPVIYRPDAKREFGRSRITRACMSLQDSAIRTAKRSEIAAEFYSYPQKWVTGLSDDFDGDRWKANMSSILTFTKDEDGDHPIMGQFQMSSMTPHTEQLKMFASMFAGETGLTLDDLGFPTANPSSADAIKASHENLRLTARKAQKCFGSAFINAGIVAASYRDNFEYQRKAFYRTRTVWKPLFEPDGSAMSVLGDSVIKMNNAVPNFFNQKTLSELTGFEPAEEE